MTADEFFSMKKQIEKLKRAERCFTNRELRGNYEHVKLREGILATVLPLFKIRSKWGHGKMSRIERHFKMRYKVLSLLRETAFFLSK